MVVAVQDSLASIPRLVCSPASLALTIQEPSPSNGRDGQAGMRLEPAGLLVWWGSSWQPPSPNFGRWQHRLQIIMVVSPRCAPLKSVGEGRAFGFRCLRG